jgi:hypothetical protein
MGITKTHQSVGGEHIKALESRKCDPQTCPNVERRGNGHLGHKEILGGNYMKFSPKAKGRVPEKLVRYLCNFLDPNLVADIRADLSRMRLIAMPEGRFDDGLDYECLEEMAQVMAHLEEGKIGEEFVCSVDLAAGNLEGEEVERRRTQVLKDYGQTVFTTIMPKERPVRGPFGEAAIVLKPGAQPVKQRPFHLLGEQKEALTKLIDELMEEGKLEDGISAWSSPAFPVPKKKPGGYRLVVDYRSVNDATITDAHPLPRIEDILQKQGKFKVWSVLDIKYGYHQLPLRKEDRHITCMSTPRGTKQWTVLVMGLKNGGAIFQRMMEWVLRGIECASVYIDDVLVGSDGETM